MFIPPSLAIQGAQFIKMTIQDYFAHPAPTTRSAQISSSKNSSSSSAEGGSSSAEFSGVISNFLNGLQSKPELMEKISQKIQETGKKYNISEKLISSLMRAESNFDPNAISPAGAQGLMQLMPETAKELGVKDSMNIDQNIEGGVKYLRQMLDLFGQDVQKALAAYNAGPGAVKKYGGIPPYAETQKYVSRIIQNFRSVV